MNRMFIMDQLLPLDIHSQYERQIKDLQEAYGEVMLELRARKKLQSLLDEAEK